LFVFEKNEEDGAAKVTIECFRYLDQPCSVYVSILQAFPMSNNSCSKNWTQLYRPWHLWNVWFRKALSSVCRLAIDSMTIILNNFCWWRPILLLQKN